MLAVAWDSGHHHKGDVSVVRLRAQGLEHLAAVHARHHIVAEDQAGCVRFKASESFAAIVRLEHLVSFIFQKGFKDIKYRPLIVYDKYLIHDSWPWPWTLATPHCAGSNGLAVPVSMASALTNVP